MQKFITLLATVISIAAFISTVMVMVQVNPNEQKIDALSSAITTFEKMLSDNQRSESIPLEDVIDIEKAIKKFESRRHWQYVGNYIVAVVFGLIAAAVFAALTFTVSHRLMNSKRASRSKTPPGTEP
jgi:hypothetical protein